VHVLIASLMLLAAWLAPRAFLWILGQQYAGLDHELVLVVAGAGLALVDGYLVALNLSRAWTRWQGLAMGSLLAAQAVLVVVLPLGTSAGVLTFNVLSAASALVGQAVIAGLGFARPQWVEWDSGRIAAPAG
jgi:hypothetical protein